MAKGFRKKMQRQQGLKILAYGADTTGKSVFALSFPKIAYVDTESKIGVYENNPKYNKNLEDIADTVNYYEVLNLTEQVIKNYKDYETFVTDSETNLYDDMQVSVMEVEEKKAKRFGKDIDDAVVAQRGWGKVKLNNARFRNIKAQMSALGITVISVAHMKDIFEDQGGKSVKIGEKPELKAGSTHDYDIILRFYKDGKKFCASVEKDTTQTHQIGDVIQNPSYNNWKEYIENNRKSGIVDTQYDQAIDKNIEDMAVDDEEVAQKEMTNLKSEIVRICSENGGSKNSTIMDILKKYEPTVGNPNKIKDPNMLKGLLAELKNEFEPENEENE